jgi:hypothetical protein
VWGCVCVCVCARWCVCVSVRVSLVLEVARVLYRVHDGLQQTSCVDEHNDREGDENELLRELTAK